MFDWTDVLTFIFIAGFFLFLLSTLILRLTLDRRVRKALPPDKIYDSEYDSYFGYGRTLVFGAACVSNYFNNSPKIRYLYDDFDVQAFANRFEKVMAYCMVGSLATIVICIFVVLITEWLGIYDWSQHRR
jgi:uncharacterized membrane protein